MNSFNFLIQLHPLIKILAITPLLILGSLTENPWILSFFSLESILLLFLGSGISTKKLFFILGSLLLGATFYFVLFTLTTPAKKDTFLLFSWGPLSISKASLDAGLLTTTRVSALVLLSFLFAGTTSVTTLLYSLMQQGRLPYRIGYTVAAAYHFVPVLWQELQLVRSAQQIRGFVGNNPKIWYQRLKRLSLTLFVSSIRRAERLALSMESRSFGAYTTCTYYRQISLVKKDIITLIIFWIINGLYFFLLT